MIDYLLTRLPPGAEHRHVMIPMRDGVRLATHVFLPAGHKTNAYPVVLIRSAYDHWTGNNRSRHLDRVVDRTAPGSLTYNNETGYVVVLQDLRGDGDSEAEPGFEARLSLNEIHDTYDTIEALITNRWCNGRVGMTGGSGHGMAAYMGWLCKHSNLVVVAPGNTAPDLYSHWSFDHGVLRWSYQWLNNVNAKTSAWPKPTLGHYGSRQQWRDALTNGAADNQTILIHNADRWFNFFMDATFEVFSVLDDTHRGYLVMDRGNHQGEIDELPFPRAPAPPERPVMPSFLDILDGATVTNRPFLDYYVLGDARRGAGAVGNFRRVTERWPPPATDTAWYFHADGTLSTHPPTSAVAYRSYAYHPTNPVPSVGGHFSYGFKAESGPKNQWVPALTQRHDIIRLESEPFSSPVEITGAVCAELYVSTDVEDTTFMVKLIDVYPAEGTNAAYHALMRESARMGRYRNGFSDPQPMQSGAIYRLNITLPTIAWMVEPGHRLAVHITSSSAPAFEVHPNSYEPVMSYDASPTATIHVHMSQTYPSRIVVPYYTASAENNETASYTVEEGETYGRGQYRLLHPAFAGGVWQRQQNPQPHIVVSLIGWPDRDAVFLPETITFVGVSWLHPVSPQSWTRHFEKVIAVHAKNGPVSGRPSRHALKKEAELQQWFDDRFDVDVAGGDV